MHCIFCPESTIVNVAVPSLSKTLPQRATEWSEEQPLSQASCPDQLLLYFPNMSSLNSWSCIWAFDTQAWSFFGLHLRFEFPQKHPEPVVVYLGGADNLDRRITKERKADNKVCLMKPATPENSWITALWGSSWIQCKPHASES